MIMEWPFHFDISVLEAGQTFLGFRDCFSSDQAGMLITQESMQKRKSEATRRGIWALQLKDEEKR